MMEPVVDMSPPFAVRLIAPDDCRKIVSPFAELSWTLASERIFIASLFAVLIESDPLEFKLIAEPLAELNSICPPAPTRMLFPLNILTRFKSSPLFAVSDAPPAFVSVNELPPMPVTR